LSLDSARDVNTVVDGKIWYTVENPLAFWQIKRFRAPRFALSKAVRQTQCLAGSLDDSNADSEIASGIAA